MTKRIKMQTPLVEMDGDEMTRIIWQKIKEILLEPYIELKTEYYDLSLPHRDSTSDQITVDAALATKRLGVAVESGALTPKTQRGGGDKFKQKGKKPKGTNKANLQGKGFCAPTQGPSLLQKVESRRPK